MAEIVGLSIALLDVSIRAVSRTTSFVTRVTEAGDTCRKLADRISAIGQLMAQLLALYTESPSDGPDTSCVIQLITDEKYLEQCQSILTNIHQVFDRCEPCNETEPATLWKQLCTARGAAQLEIHAKELESIHETLKGALNLDTAKVMVSLQGQVKEINTIVASVDKARLLDWIAPLNVAYESCLTTVLAQKAEGTGE